MKKGQNNVDKIVSEILNEEIENKAKKFIKKLQEGEWTEITVDEALKGGQKKIDVAEPKGKLTAADFKKLRSKKKETKEDWEKGGFFFPHDAFDKESGNYEGNKPAENKAEALSSKEPTYVGRGLKDNQPGKMFGSFSDEHGWFDDSDREFGGDFDFEYDEESFDEFEPFYEKYGLKQKWFGHGNQGKRFFDQYKEKYGSPFKVRTRKGLEEEAETEEGNAFSGALAKAKESGKDSFEVDGKTYQVKEEKKDKKWIQKTGMKKGALHKKLGVPEGDKIPTSKLKSLKSELSKKAEGDKKLSASDSKLLKQVNLAMTLKGLKENKNKISLTEDELIEMIEKIVLEQKKENKENIQKKKPEGLKKTEKVQGQSKKENEDYAKEVVEKMKKYIKDGSKGEFQENPEDFPQNNYTLDGMKEKTMKYHPSKAVDEYIDAFAYPGMTNLVYDEIKPDDERIEKYLKGDSTTGNAEKDKDGKPLGNVVPSKVGEKMMKNYQDNLYGAEQQQASYKRQPSPVDVAGSEKSEASLTSIRKGSAKKASKIMSQLESTDKRTTVINEEMIKMKNLISYNRKTQ